MGAKQNNNIIIISNYMTKKLLFYFVRRPTLVLGVHNCVQQMAISHP